MVGCEVGCWVAGLLERIARMEGLLGVCILEWCGMTGGGFVGFEAVLEFRRVSAGMDGWQGQSLCVVSLFEQKGIV